MKLFLALLLLTALAVPGTAQIGGPLLTSDEDGFSITLPADATVPTPRKFNDPHTRKWQFTRYQTDVGAKMYVVTVSPAPAGDPQKYLSDFQDHIARSPRGEALGKPVTDPVKGYPAISVRRRAEESGHIIYDRMTVVVTASRVYMLMFSTPDKDDLDKDDTRAFFNSLIIR